MKTYGKNSLYYSSQHLVYRCCYHVIFCPKYRKSIFISIVSDRFKEICLEITEKYDFIIEEIETDSDHAHMIINCNPRFGIVKCVQLIKQITAHKLFQEFGYIKKYSLWGGNMWSMSIFIPTVGSVSLEVVKEYIKNQGN